MKKLFKAVIIIVVAVIVINILNKKELKNSESTSEQPEVKITKDEVKLTIFGDLLFEEPLYKDMASDRSGNDYFKRVKTKYFDNDDLSIGNMEVPIGTKDMKVSGEGFNFCAPESVGELLSNQSIEVLSTANNHTYDRGYDGLLSTINYFKNNTNIMTVGTYLNEDDRNTPRIIEKNNIKFGFLAYTYGTNVGVPAQYKENIGYYYGDANREKLTEEVKDIRDKVDVLIVIMHWGTEFTYNPNKDQLAMASYLNSLNVDIIIGSHSHCMQPIEWVGDDYKTLVYYSMGNFVSADDDISRTAPGNEEFDNAYQIGLLSTLKITKENDAITIDNIDTEPVVNYFDKNLKNFELIPFEDYSDEYEKGHYRYKFGMTKDWITNTYNKVIAEEFRK